MPMLPEKPHSAYGTVTMLNVKPGAQCLDPECHGYIREVSYNMNEPDTATCSECGRHVCYGPMTIRSLDL